VVDAHQKECEKLPPERLLSGGQQGAGRIVFDKIRTPGLRHLLRWRDPPELM
jgi:hypothetical protein